MAKKDFDLMGEFITKNNNVIESAPVEQEEKKEILKPKQATKEDKTKVCFIIPSEQKEVLSALSNIRRVAISDIVAEALNKEFEKITPEEKELIEKYMQFYKGIKK